MIPRTIAASDGKPLTLVVIRDGARVTLGPRPADKDAGVYRLGFLLAGEGLSPPEAARESLVTTGASRRTSSRRSDASSPARGARTSRARSGSSRARPTRRSRATNSFLWVLGLISLSIALLNLLPFLPLDGGHIVFAIVEGVSGRTVAREVYERVSIVGIGLVLLLFVIGLTNDIGRLS